MKITWFTTSGESGDYTFAHIELKPVSEGASTLNLEVREFVDVNGKSIKADVQDGKFVANLEGDNVTETPAPTSTATVTPTSTPTLTPVETKETKETEEPSPTKKPTQEVTETTEPTTEGTPTKTPTGTTTPKEIQVTPERDQPGFEAVFAVVGLLTVAVAYLLRRR